MEFPKHYSLKKEHDKSFEIHDARDQSSFHVYKKDLHPATQIKVMKLQHFDDGGDVEPAFGSWGRMDDQEARGGKESSDLFAAAPESNKAKAAREADEQGLLSLDKPQPVATGDLAEPSLQDKQQQSIANLQNTPDQVQQPQGAISAHQSPSSGMMTPQGALQLQNQELGAIQAESQGHMAQNRELSQAYALHQNEMEVRQQQYQEKYDKISAETDQLSKDVAASKVDPSNYWKNHSKLGAVIGLILGGFSQGLTGSKENPAMMILNQQINRDIEAQKMDLGKKQTLFSENLRRLGDMRAAENMTQMQMTASFNGQLAKIAAQTNNPIISAQAQQAMVKAKMSMMPLQQQVAQYQMIQDISKSGGNADEARIAVMAKTPQEAEAASKTLQSLKNHKTQAQDIMSTFDKANQENTIGGRTMRLGAEPPSAKVLQNLVMPYLKDAEGRINETEIKRVDSLMPSPGDRPSTVKAKREGFQQFLDEKKPVGAALLRYGIDPKGYDADTGEIKTMGGVQYKKTAGGWQKQK